MRQEAYQKNVMRLYVIRHCQSENNAMWASTGSSHGRSPDPELSELGHQQAACLAEFFERVQTNPPGNANGSAESYPFTHLYTSLMRRSVATGTAIASATGLPLHAWVDIHEHGGIYHRDPETQEYIGLEGTNRAFFAERFPNLQLPDDLGETGWWNRPYEPWEETHGRANRFLTELLDRHGDTDDNVAIVTHGGFSYALLGQLLGIPVEHERLGTPLEVRLRFNNGSISRFDFNDSIVRMIAFNQTHQFPPELIS